MVRRVFVSESERWCRAARRGRSFMSINPGPFKFHSTLFQLENMEDEIGDGDG